MSTNEAAAKAMELAKAKADLCKSGTEIKAAKQFKPDNVRASTSAAAAQSNNDDDDNDDVVYSARNLRSASSATSSTSDLKSLDEALKDAVKYVTKINEQITLNSKSVDLLTKKTNQENYLSENRILALIKQCKNDSNSTTAMEIDHQPNLGN